MNNRNNQNLGDEIKNIVQRALNNKDFSELNQNIGNVVKDALEEAKSSVNWKPGTHNLNKDQIYKNPNQKKYEDKTQKVRDIQTKKTSLTVRPGKYTVPVGQVSGMALSILGTIGSATFGIALFVLTVLGFTLGSFFHSISLILLPLFLFSVFVLFSGNSIRKRLKRFQKYLLCMKDKDYCQIDELSSLTGFSNKYIARDLQKMIKVGMFPEGNFDDTKTTFVLTNERYRQYLDLKRSIESKQMEKITSEREVTTSSGLNEEIRKGINEGRKLITEIKQANILIPGQEISRKLDRLEIVVGKIFDYVEIHPEKFIEIKKFTEYFLPTTYKLVDAYKNLDYQTIQGENISTAKKEIEDTLDTINLAFENLLDDLFHDISMDISTDISVLETMLAQEGLTGNDMRIKYNTREDKQNE